MRRFLTAMALGAALAAVPATGAYAAHRPSHGHSVRHAVHHKAPVRHAPVRKTAPAAPRPVLQTCVDGWANAGRGGPVLVPPGTVLCVP